MHRLSLILLLTAASLAAACASVHPTLGPPTPKSLVVVGPTEGKYRYFVHMSGDPAMADRQARVNKARELISRRCAVIEVNDLYMHVIGTKPDGSPLLSYSVGIICGEER